MADGLLKGWAFGRGVMDDAFAAKRTGKLAALASQAYGAEPTQRSGLVQQAIGVDPNAGFALGKQLGQDDDARNERLGMMARVLTSVPEDARPSLYRQMVPELSRFGLSSLPPEYTQEVGQIAQQLADALGDAAGVPSGVREFQYMTRGMGNDDALRARRIALGLDPRSSSAAIQYKEVVGSDGKTRIVALDPREVGSQVIGDGATYGSGVQSPQGNPFASLTASVPGLRVTSATRTPEQNTRAGGVDNSFHLTGQAIDIGTPSPGQQQAILQWASQNDHEVIRNYKDGHWHLEPRGGAPRQQGGVNPLVSQSPAERKFAEEAGQQSAQIATLGQRGEIEARNAAAKTLAEEQARAAAAQQFGTKESREAAVEARKKLPQLNNAVRGITRIEQALQNVNKGMLGDTGPVDQIFQRYTKDGQELEAAVGAIQNSILALTRVPGVGSQSDLEQRVAMLQYPSLDKAPEVNARTIANLRLFMQDLQNAYQQVTGGQQEGGTGGGGSKRLKFNPATGRIE